MIDHRDIDLHPYDDTRGYRWLTKTVLAAFIGLVIYVLFFGEGIGIYLSQSARITLVWCAVILVIYFLPLIVARWRHHRQRMAIGVLNLFLGWTLLGWVIALVWACTADVETSGWQEPSA